MKNTPWLYLDPRRWPASWPATPADRDRSDHAPGTVALPEAEARHALGALRLREGDEAVLFDGRGRKARVRLLRSGEAMESGGRPGSGDVCAQPVRFGFERKNRPLLTLAVAIPKGRRAAWMVEKCVEAGADRLAPILFTRGVSGLGREEEDEDAQRFVERWRAWAVAAAKQCQRARLPRIDPPRRWDAWLATTAKDDTLMLMGDPRGAAFPDWSRRVEAATSVTGVIGPEGGLTPEEQTALRAAGALDARWGAHILRIETAAVALAVAVRLAPGRD